MEILNMAKEIVDNPEDVETFTDPPEIVPSSSFGTGPWPGGPWEMMIIITPEFLKDEFQILADWNIDRGLRTMIVTTETINQIRNKVYSSRWR